MDRANINNAQAAIERAAMEKRRGASCVPIYADVLLDGGKIGHIVSDGYDQRVWGFHPANEKRRKSLGTILTVLPVWTDGAKLGPFKTGAELLAESEIRNQDIRDDTIYNAIASDSFPCNPIPFATGLADHVRKHGTDSIQSDDAKRILWILIGQAYGQVAKIDLVDEWNRLTKRGGTA